MEGFYTHLNPHNLLLEMAEVGRFEEFKICVYGNHQTKLNNKDKKRIIEWLKSPHKSFGKYGLSNWQVICIYWDDNNPDYPFNKEAEMPDYENLK